MTVLAVLLCIPLFSAVAYGAVIQVPAGGNLQDALNRSQPGDEIVLQAGATYTGTFTLPQKPDGAVITVRSSATLPARRIGPADAALLPKIQSSSTAPAIEGAGAKNWTFDGIQFLSTQDGMYNIVYTHNVRLSSTTFRNTENLTFDRILILGGPNGQHRALATNGANITITRSYIGNIRKVGEESKAIGIWDGPGPFRITDNFLEAAGMSIIFGGADSSSAAHIPADITVEDNYMTKRLAEWTGGGFGMKNVFELKSALRVVIRRNVMERSIPDGQSGFAVLFTSNNDGCNSPWTRVEDVLFEQNVVRDARRGFSILGTSYGCTTMQGTNIVIRNNLVQTTGEIFSIGAEVGRLTIEHNTFVNGNADGRLGILYRGQVNPTGGGGFRNAQYAVQTLIFRANLAADTSGGLFGDEVGSGMAALTAHVRTVTWTGNVLAGKSGPHTYPAGNWHPPLSEYQAQFNSDYTLRADSLYRTMAPDGGALGRRIEGVSPPPPPPPPPPQPPPPGPVLTWDALTIPPVVRGQRLPDTTVRVRGGTAPYTFVVRNIEGWPTNLNFTATPDGAVTWTGEAQRTGTFAVEHTATDATGASASTIVTFAFVDEPPPPPPPPVNPCLANPVVLRVNRWPNVGATTMTRADFQTNDPANIDVTFAAGYRSATAMHRVTKCTVTVTR